MAQYVDWGSWAAVQYSSGTDWTSVDIADEADLVSDAVSLDTKVSAEVSVAVVEDNTGACDGDVYVYLLRDTDGTNYEDFTADDDNDDPELVMVIDATQNKTRRGTFTVLAERVGSFKVAVDNDCGQTVTTTLKYRTSNIGSA
jgi:hypothetical protein